MLLNSLSRVGLLHYILALPLNATNQQEEEEEEEEEAAQVVEIPILSIRTGNIQYIGAVKVSWPGCCFSLF